jgi:hypothetical protein
MYCRIEKRVNSPLLKDALKVLTNTIGAVGKIAELLEFSADDVRSSLELRDKM